MLPSMAQARGVWEIAGVRVAETHVEVAVVGRAHQPRSVPKVGKENRPAKLGWTVLRMAMCTIFSCPEVQRTRMSMTLGRASVSVRPLGLLLAFVFQCRFLFLQANAVFRGMLCPLPRVAK